MTESDRRKRFDPRQFVPMFRKMELFNLAVVSLVFLCSFHTIPADKRGMIASSYFCVVSFLVILYEGFLIRFRIPEDVWLRALNYAALALVSILINLLFSPQFEVTVIATLSMLGMTLVMSEVVPFLLSKKLEHLLFDKWSIALMIVASAFQLIRQAYSTPHPYQFLGMGVIAFLLFPQFLVMIAHPYFDWPSFKKRMSKFLLLFLTPALLIMLATGVDTATMVMTTLFALIYSQFGTWMVPKTMREAMSRGMHGLAERNLFYRVLCS